MIALGLIVACAVSAAVTLGLMALSALVGLPLGDAAAAILGGGVGSSLGGSIFVLWLDSLESR